MRAAIFIRSSSSDSWCCGHPRRHHRKVLDSVIAEGRSVGGRQTLLPGVSIIQHRQELNPINLQRSQQSLQNVLASSIQCTLPPIAELTQDRELPAPLDHPEWQLCRAMAVILLSAKPFDLRFGSPNHFDLRSCATTRFGRIINGSVTTRPQVMTEPINHPAAIALNAGTPALGACLRRHSTSGTTLKTLWWNFWA